MHISQIGVRVEGGLKLLRIDLSIFIQDMSVHTCYHIDLCVSRIALCGLQIAVVEL